MSANAVTYSPNTETFTTGSKYNYDGGEYIYIQKEATGRFFRYDIANSAMEGLTAMLYTQGAAAPSTTKKTTFIWIKQGSTWRLTIPNMRISGSYKYVQPYIKVSGNWK